MNVDYPSEVFSRVDGGTPRAAKRLLVKENPATGEMLAKVVPASEGLVNQAVKNATKAQARWCRQSLSSRAMLLRKAVEAIEEACETFTDLLALECGKPKRHACAEVTAASECGRFFAGLHQHSNGVLLPSSVVGRRLFLERESIGVGALITPFNNPLAGIAWKLFPTLLCGNAVILKAHEYVPLLPVVVAELFEKIGVPAGVISVLQGGPAVGQMLVKHPGVSFVSFTGSSQAGKAIAAVAGSRLAKVSIEGGGKNPLIVCYDADIDRAVSAAVNGAFVDGGQRCAATSRIIVSYKPYEAFVTRFRDRVSGLKVGIDDDCDYGAIISSKRLKAVQQEVNRCAKRNIAYHLGVIQGRKRGFFLGPVVFEDIASDDPLLRRELFGPVVTIQRVSSDEEAIALANSVPYRLTAAVHTSDMKRAEQYIHELHCGVVRVNGTTHGSEPHVPFGGVGESGNGAREPGEAALDFYSNWKQISFDS